MSEYSVFTSESVSEGHPDKMADQISDAVVDAMLKDDPNSRVAVETLVKTGMVVLATGCTGIVIVASGTLAVAPGMFVVASAISGQARLACSARLLGLIRCGHKRTWGEGGDRNSTTL